MGRVLHIGSVMLLALGSLLASDQKSPKEPPPPPPPKAKAVKAAAPPGGQPKAFPKGAQRLINPTNVFTHLYKMTPAQRDQVIERLGPKQQEQVRKNLDWFDALPKETQESVIRRIDRFEKLPPEKRAEVAALVKEANELPAPRRAAVGRQVFQLQQMTDQERAATLARPKYQERFSLEEFRIISGLADAWLGSQQQ